MLALPETLRYTEGTEASNRRRNMNATCTLIRTAQPMGQYKPTSLDAAKAAADFLLTDVSCGNRIVWRDGRRETVTDRKLAKLQAAYTWATDF